MISSELQNSLKDNPRGEDDDPIVITAFDGVFPDAPTPELFWQAILQRKAAQLSPSGREETGGSAPDGEAKSQPRLAYHLTENPWLPTDSSIDDRQVRLAKALLSRFLNHLQTNASRLRRDEIDLVLAASWCGSSYFHADFTRMMHQQGVSSAAMTAIRDFASYEKQMRTLSAGLKGIALATDTACASSLYALDLACSMIRSGQSRAVIVMGMNAWLPPFLFSAFSRLGALSPSNTILPFSDKANGIMFGEAIGAILIERLSSARASCREPLAVIRGIGLSADGADKSIFFPSFKGQQLALSRAYQDLATLKVDYIETHGTGTPSGDKVEIEALQWLFGESTPAQSRIPIGSVKSLFGHPLAAAGIVAIIKCLFILKHKIIPPHLDVTPNEALPGSCLFLPKEQISLAESQGPLRVGITSLGFGGSNAHLVLEALPASRATTQTSLPVPPFEPLAIISMAGFLGGRRIGEDGPGEARTPRQPITLPTQCVIDRAPFKMGAAFLRRIDTFQLLLAHSANCVLAGHHDREKTGVLIGANLGGDSAMRSFCRNSWLSAPQQGMPQEEVHKIADSLGQESNTEAIASAMPAMCSGYSAHLLDLSGFHQTVSGAPGLFFQLLALSGQFCGKKARQLVLGAGRMIKGPHEWQNIKTMMASSSDSLQAGEGLAVFLVKQNKAAQEDSDSPLAIITHVIDGREAPTLDDAYRMAGFGCHAIDHIEICQLNNFAHPDSYGDAQKTTGYLCEAVGVESLCRAILNCKKRAVIEVRDHAQLVRTIFLEKGAQPFTPHVDANPMTLQFPKRWRDTHVKDTEQHCNLASQAATESTESARNLQKPSTISPSDRQRTDFAFMDELLQSYFQAQRTILSMIDPQSSVKSIPGKTKADKGAKIVPLSAAGSSEVICDVEMSSPQSAKANLVVDESHPYFFDHPLDHVPGILLLAAVLELAAILIARESQKTEVKGLGRIDAFSIKFFKYCEKNKNTEVQITLLEQVQRDRLKLSGQIMQGKNRIVSFGLELTMGSMPSAPADGDTRGAANSDVSYADIKMLHKQKNTNVMLAPLQKVDAGHYRAELLPPSPHHYLSSSCRTALGPLYLLETVRQFMMLLVHSVGDIATDKPMILVAVTSNLKGSWANARTPLYWSYKPTESKAEGAIMVFEPVLLSADESFGSVQISAIMYDKKTYEDKRSH